MSLSGSPGAKAEPIPMREQGMRLTILGSGTPSPSLRRQSSGYLIELPGKTIVVDHGGGAFQRFLETGRQPTEVTHLFLSHLHSDHILDVPRLVLGRWDQSGGDLPPLKVFGPAPVTRTFGLLFGPDGAFAPDIRARCTHPASLAIFEARGGRPPRPPPQFDLTEVRAGARLEEDQLTVLVGRAQHFEPMLECLCFRFKAEGTDLVYTGDTGFSDEVCRFASDCDVLIAMCQYLEGTPLPPAARETAASHIEVARMAQLSNADTLVLTHLSQQFDDPLVRASAHREMAKIFHGAIIWGEDGLSLALGGEARNARFD